VILFKLLSAFGPLPDALIKHVNDEKGGALLKDLWQAITEAESNERFERWSEEMFPNLDDEAKRLILRMTNLDPTKRALMSDIVMDPYWKMSSVPTLLIGTTNEQVTTQKLVDECIALADNKCMNYPQQLST
jgi:hypothetical protein